ncbi:MULTISPECIES: hypothetical protein [Cyanophyceae]|uniref:hypothetical protein n=1 Tax=Cyanophyceae TaxID=3028117 RepID=UPI001687C4C2|nr:MULTISPECIES: hypothetical protein [Cyanophyceae]MBD1915791.1 hypothetical protein [Phormidium sp. FACHB-77]MBD2030535.1 hypothetical protein [Phormidium sp. FACHB-322]MBD2053537.1 hypothetical protein [Leptolyngbya sp. FACHB-60]
MDDSPFRRIVLPALLASSAGFAALTWPMAADRAAQVSERLPQPLSRWVDSALITNQHQASIRYIGFTVLSSLAIGIGTAETMRVRQHRGQRHQDLLDQVLDDEQADFGGDRLTTTASINQLHATDLAASHDPVQAAPTVKVATTLDWTSLPSTVPNTQTKAELMSSPMDEHALYHIQGADQCRSLALAIEGEYYRYYRNRPNLDKARSLVQQLHQQGKRALATWDDKGYVVWVHHAERPQQAVPWVGRLATS